MGYVGDIDLKLIHFYACLARHVSSILRENYD